MENKICPVCKIECQEYDAMVLITFETTSPVHGHVWKQFWHKQCYVINSIIGGEYIEISST